MERVPGKGEGRGESQQENVVSQGDSIHSKEAQNKSAQS